MKKRKFLNDNKQIAVGFSVLCICFLLFVIAKGFCLFYYNPNRSRVVTLADEINIVNNKLYGTANLDTFNATLPDEFVKDDTVCGDLKYCVGYSLNGDSEKSSIFIVKSMSSLDFHSNIFEKVSDFNAIFDFYNVDSEYELLDYYFNNPSDVTIFNSLSKIKMKYLSNMYVNFITFGNDVYRLVGDVKGFMYKNAHKYIVSLYEGNTVYMIAFSDNDMSEYFNEFIVTDILETVYFR